MTELTSKTAQHAQRELELLGEDSGVATSIVEAIEAFFTTYRHSGGSAGAAIPLLERLIRGEALTPLTSDPAEWEDRTAMSGSPMWQNRRDSRAVSKDGGRTWWYVEGRHPGERCYDADELGTLIRCQMCGGTGLLHELVLERGPGPQPQESP